MLCKKYICWSTNIYFLQIIFESFPYQVIDIFVKKSADFCGRLQNRAVFVKPIRNNHLHTEKPYLSKGATQFRIQGGRNHSAIQQGKS